MPKRKGSIHLPTGQPTCFIPLMDALNAGDSVLIDYAPSDDGSSILDAYVLIIEG